MLVWGEWSGVSSRLGEFDVDCFEVFSLSLDGVPDVKKSKSNSIKVIDPIATVFFWIFKAMIY